jgi:hypothetical protein
MHRYRLARRILLKAHHARVNLVVMQRRKLK